MSPRRRAPSRWYYASGERPNTVVVREKVAGGPIVAMTWDPVTKRQVQASLGHRDRDAAMEYADKEAAKLRGGRTTLAASGAIGDILGAYLAHRTPDKQSPEQRQEDVRRSAMWIRYFGAARKATTLGRAEWEGFIRDRSTGVINARGERETPKRLPGPRAVDADLVFLQSVFNWACTWRVAGRPLLTRNPWGVPQRGVRNPLERPRNKAPARPMMTPDRFRALRDVADGLMMVCGKSAPGAHLIEMGEGKHPVTGVLIPVRWWMRTSYLGELMDLAAQTGRRISAICRLRYSDIIRTDRAITAIRWRPIKKEDETIVPVSRQTAAVLRRILRDRPGLGDNAIFPRRGDANGKPIGKGLALDWLAKAEFAAGLPHIPGGGWHMSRRAWATLRKGMPAVDVKRAGGWKDTRSLEACYTLSDDPTVLAVVNAPTVDALAGRAGR